MKMDNGDPYPAAFVCQTHTKIIQLLTKFDGSVTDGTRFKRSKNGDSRKRIRLVINEHSMLLAM